MAKYKSKYNPETITAICKAIKAQKGRVNACKEAGICYDTFLTWTEKHPEFVELIKKAESQAKQTRKETALLSIMDAMEKSWQAAAWLLEREHPEEYALRNKVEHSGALGITINFGNEDKAL